MIYFLREIFPLWLRRFNRDDSMDGAARKGMKNLASEKVIHLTDGSFQSEVLDANGTVLVDFWAAWCGPCRMLSPLIDQLAEEQSEIKICKLDVDQYGALAAQYGVLSIPTVVIFKNGEETNRTIGVVTKEELLKAASGQS